MESFYIFRRWFIIKKQDFVKKYCMYRPVSIYILKKIDKNGKQKWNISVSFSNEKRDKLLNSDNFLYLLNEEDVLVEEIIIDYLDNSGKIVSIDYNSPVKRPASFNGIRVVKNDGTELFVASDDLRRDFSYLYDELEKKKYDDFYSSAVDFIDGVFVNNIIITFDKLNLSGIGCKVYDNKYLVKRSDNIGTDVVLKYFPLVTSNDSFIRDEDVFCISKILMYYINKYSKDLLEVSLKKDECIYTFNHSIIKIVGEEVVSKTISCYFDAMDIINKNKDIEMKGRVR